MSLCLNKELFILMITFITVLNLYYKFWVLYLYYNVIILSTKNYVYFLE